MKASMKKATNVALAAALLSGAWATTASANGIEFTDVPSINVHYDNIYNLANRAVITGYPDGTYQPARLLTRAEAAVILTNALELDTAGVSDPGFPDVKKGSWYYEEVAALTEWGIISGYNTGKFGPNDKLTRAQMASILTSAYSLYTADYVDTPFTDVVAGSWYDDYVQALYYFNVTSGVSKTKYAPNDFVRRDAMASFVVNSEMVSEEVKAEELMPFWSEMYNDDSTNPAKTSLNLDTNTMTVNIAATRKMVDKLYETDLFFFILPGYQVQSSYIKGTDFDLTAADYNDAYDYIIDYLGVTYESDLNDLGGKSITFVYECRNGETFEYTVNFQNQ